MVKKWKTKAEFAKYLRKRRIELGLSQEYVSHKIGKSGGYIFQVERGRILPDIMVLPKLAEVYEDSADDYLSMRVEEVSKREQVLALHQQKSQTQGHIERMFPVINLAQCGNWVNFTDKDFPAGVADEYLPGRSRDPNAFYVIAEGDSMMPDIKPGEPVLIEPNTEVQPNNVVLARTDEGVILKRIEYLSDGRILLRSKNEAYALIEVKDRRSFRAFRARYVLHEL
jgi:phage repressor protein C with HTH and peptisase S24 domain